MNDIIFKTLLLKGEAGNNIIDIKKTSSDGLVDTYTITRTDGVTTTFEVTNGKSITDIKKTGSTGLVDTYTITYNDETTSTFTVTNGKDGKDDGITVDDSLSETSTNPVQNKVITNSINREVLRTIPNINIPENADINTPEYLNVGTYCCNSNNTASTVSNIPHKSAFCMYVIAILGGQYGSESSMKWLARMRIFISLDSYIYVQVVTSGENEGVYTYSNWKKLISSDELNTITILNS